MENITFSGDLLGSLEDLVERVLLKYRFCDGHDFDHGIPVDCPLTPIVNINGQDFCARHQSQAWVNQ